MLRYSILTITITSTATLSSTLHNTIQKEMISVNEKGLFNGVPLISVQGIMKSSWILHQAWVCQYDEKWVHHFAPYKATTKTVTPLAESSPKNAMVFLFPHIRKHEKRVCR